MTKVTYHSPTGADVTLDVPPGVSIMQAAIKGGVDGILADCGGQLQCATCHVYVPEQYADQLPPMSEDEDDMLEITACERTDRSRLSCQLVMNDEIDQIDVELPEHQR